MGWKAFKVFPKFRATSANPLGPKTRRATTAMTRASGAPTPRRDAETPFLCRFPKSFLGSIRGTLDPPPKHPFNSPMPLIKVPLIKTLTCPPALLHLVSCFCPHCPYGFTVDTFKDCHEAEEVRSREEQEGEKGERVRESGATEEREVAGKVSVV